MMSLAIWFWKFWCHDKRVLVGLFGLRKSMLNPTTLLGREGFDDSAFSSRSDFIDCDKSEVWCFSRTKSSIALLLLFKIELEKLRSLPPLCSIDVEISVMSSIYRYVNIVRASDHCETLGRTWLYSQKDRRYTVAGGNVCGHNKTMSTTVYGVLEYCTP